MGSDNEPDPYSTPKLPLFSIPQHLSEPSGMSTPPLQTTASVPFRWEEQPGKPRPCTDLIVASTHRTKCLDLPPRLAMVEPAKTSSPSPTTVLDGPIDVGGKSFFSSSSFRFATERRRRRERRRRSFDSNGSGGWSPTDDCGGQQQMLLLGNKVDRRDGGRGLFGSFRIRGSTSTNKLTSSSTSSIDAGFLKTRKMRRNSSVSKVTGSQFWAKIYEGFKQVVPWRKKPKIECEFIHPHT